MPFCNVCKNAGKPESVYKSHFVRQTPHKLSPVTCPTILNNKCNHCSCKGHFISDCPLAKEERKIQKSENNRKRKLQAIEEAPKVQPAKKNINVFDVLGNEDEDDDVEEQIMVENNTSAVAVDHFKPNDSFVTKTRGVVNSWSALMDSDDEEE